MNRFSNFLGGIIQYVVLMVLILSLLSTPYIPLQIAAAFVLLLALLAAAALLRSQVPFRLVFLISLPIVFLPVFTDLPVEEQGVLTYLQMTLIAILGGLVLTRIRITREQVISRFSDLGVVIGAAALLLYAVFPPQDWLLAIVAVESVILYLALNTLHRQRSGMPKEIQLVLIVLLSLVIVWSGMVNYTIRAELRRAERLIREGQVDTALASYLHVEALNPQERTAITQLGDIYFERRQWSEALYRYERLQRLSDDALGERLARRLKGTLKGLAESQLIVGNFAEARAYLERIGGTDELVPYLLVLQGLSETEITGALLEFIQRLKIGIDLESLREYVDGLLDTIETGTIRIKLQDEQLARSFRVEVESSSLEQLKTLLIDYLEHRARQASDDRETLHWYRARLLVEEDPNIRKQVEALEQALR